MKSDAVIEQANHEIQTKQQQQTEELRTANIEVINIEELDIVPTIDKMTAQQFGNYLGERIRLDKAEMAKLKIIIDEGVGRAVTSSTTSNFNVNTKEIMLQISPGNQKLKNIPVDIETINGRTLSKDWPLRFKWGRRSFCPRTDYSRLSSTSIKRSWNK